MSRFLRGLLRGAFLGGTWLAATHADAAAPYRVLLLGDASRETAFRQLAREMRAPATEKGASQVLTDPRAGFAVVAPAPTASLDDVANLAWTADAALLVVDATKGPTAVLREHVLLARQTWVPRVDILFVNANALGAATKAEAKTLLGEEEDEVRELLKTYASLRDDTVVYVDSTTTVSRRAFEKAGLAVLVAALRAGGETRPGPRTASTVLEIEAVVYVLTTAEAPEAVTIRAKSNLSLWIEGETRTASVTAGAPMNPGDNSTLSLRLATAAPASKGSRFFLTRGGHLVGVGTVANIVR